jgi:hypothetical protein
MYMSFTTPCPIIPQFRPKHTYAKPFLWRKNHGEVVTVLFVQGLQSTVISRWGAGRVFSRLACVVMNSDCSTMPSLCPEYEKELMAECSAVGTHFYFYFYLVSNFRPSG